MKRSPLKRNKGLDRGNGGNLKRTRLSPVSDKRKKEMTIYSALRKELLDANPICQICDKAKSTDCHHKAKRGKNYTNAETFMALCRGCHDRVEQNLSWARENGYLY